HRFTNGSGVGWLILDAVAPCRTLANLGQPAKLLLWVTFPRAPGCLATAALTSPTDMRAGRPATGKESQLLTTTDATSCVHRITRINDCFLSIERQRCAVFVVVHAREVILRIYAPRPTKKEFIEGFHGAWSQGIDDTTESDLREVWFCPS